MNSDKTVEKIDAFKLWYYNGIMWTAHMANDSVLEQLAQLCAVEALVVNQKLSYHGHIMRRKDGMEMRLCCA